MPRRDGGAERPTRVLVTGAGGPAAVSFMRAVGDLPVELWAVDIDPCAAGLYLVPPGRRALVPRGEDPAFVDAVVARCQAGGIDVVVPTVDTELLPLSRRRDELAAAGVAVVVPTVATLEACLDKWTLIQRCQGAVPVPRTAVLDASFDPAAPGSAGWGWPVIAKPRQGSGSRGVVLVEGPEDLAALPRDGHLIVQEHLPGVEHSLDVLAYHDGSVAAVVPRSRLKVDSGIAVAGAVRPDEALEELGRRVAEVIGLTTVANVQVKADADGQPRLLEVNPRFPGSMPLTVAAGANMPALSLADALGWPVPATVAFEPLAMVRHWDEVFLPVDELEELVP